MDFGGYCANRTADRYHDPSLARGCAMRRVLNLWTATTLFVMASLFGVAWLLLVAAIMKWAWWTVFG